LLQKNNYCIFIVWIIELIIAKIKTEFKTKINFATKQYGKK